MLFRVFSLLLYISVNIFFTDAQNVLTKPPKNSCVSTSAVLECPVGYVVVVRSALFGVAHTPGSCSYTVGDCIADAMSIMTCTGDSITCSVYITRRRLPTCNDHFADYAFIEYDCVPIEMTDQTKEYNVCQNGVDITSDHGIIHSPGYPTQFQTTTSECFRAIHVPDNKTIRLWLSDLFIGSTSTNCADDHLYVVDNVQTYRDCGTRRLAYPYLCSSTIIIQYLVTTAQSHYRGMRMYFEIVDRMANDGCPNSNTTVTLVPATTPRVTTIEPETSTSPPIYVILGIASPIRPIQLCKGDSYVFQCPNNYVVSIIKNIFGSPASDQCETYDEKHCAIATAPLISCRQSCSYFYGGQQHIPACNKVAAYQYIEYQCIPTHSEIISNASCPTDGSVVPIQINEKGRIQSYHYPNLQTANCIYRVTTKPGYVMRFYSLDLSLNAFSTDCQANNLTVTEKDIDHKEVYCKREGFNLIYSSCSNQVDLHYIITSAELFAKGFELYVESQARPSVWDCGVPLSTSSLPPTVPTTPYTTPTATPIKNETSMNALAEIERNICFNSSVDDPCPTGYTFMIIGAFYGVKSSTGNKCGFTQGDCVQEALSTLTVCRNDVPNCRLAYSNKQRLSQCSDNYADYLHVTSQCVPSVPTGTGATIQKYDICDTNTNIRDINGIVTSPNFPTFQSTSNECKRTIVDIQDRVLKIWINELAVSSTGVRNSQDNLHYSEPDLVIYKTSEINSIADVEQMFPSIRDICANDYLMINTPKTASMYCGTRKLAIAPICSKSVDIHYKATSPANIFYKGFKFYFEWIEKPLGVICDGTHPTGNTTTPVDEPLPDWAQNLQLSPVLSKHLCLGTSTTLRCPRGSDYVLSIIDASYGVTGSGFCEIPTSSHCRQEASLGLTCAQSCLVEYNIPKSLTLCQSQEADYLNIDYECIPTRLPDHETPIDICSTTSSDTIAIDSGMMMSPQYPTATGTHSCSKKIQTLNNKLWMVFIVDLYVKEENTFGQCDTASLTIFDGKDKIVRCGLHQPELVLISCSDIIEFQYVSNPLASDYRGFKVYFQTVDVPDDWACKPTGYTVVTTQTTPRPTATTTTLVPPSYNVVAYAGTTNNTRQFCKLPFKYQGNDQLTCSELPPPGPTTGRHSNDPWCSLTDVYETERQWGFCDIGVTEPTIYDVCRSKSQLLKCPSGYVIDILTADFAAKPDGSSDTSSCFYDQNDCFQSDTPTVQSQCAGLSICSVLHLPKPLALCQNRQSAYYHVDYTCIPNTIPQIPTYDMCTSGSILQNDTHRGFIVSPNYPNLQTNIDCTFNLQILKNHQDIYVYIIEMDLSPPNTTGEHCVNDRLIVTSDNAVNEMCGRSFTNLLAYTCHQSVRLQLIRTAGATGRGVKFYFEFRDKPPTQLCPSLPSTTTTSAGSTLSPTTTTTAVPSYHPHPSPRMLKSLCYPDYSGLLGEKNFECPDHYVLIIHRAFYGKGLRCDYTSGDCTSEANNVYQTCAGKQSCSIPFVNLIPLLECNNQTANYLFVEYQCLPTPTIATNNGILCTGKIDYAAGVSGVLKSPSYPTYSQTQCSNNTLSSISDTNLVIYMYLLDLNIGSASPTTGNCSNDYLLLSYQCNNQLYHERLCGTQPTRLLFSTCQPTDKIFASYNLLGQDSVTHGGFALLYHLLSKSDPTTSYTTPGSITTPRVTSPITPSGPGPISTITERTTSCVPHHVTIECKTPGYVLVVHKVLLGVSATNSCTYSPNDCFEDRTSAHDYCGGRDLCDLFPPPIPIFGCNNSKADYIHVEHQCIPLDPKIDLEICSAGTQRWKVEGGAMISSIGYTSENKQCSALLRSNKLLGSKDHVAFKIFILSLNLPMRETLREQGAQCSDTDPYIDIDDHEFGVTRLCGSSHTRYLLETCSTLIEIRYNNILMSGQTDTYSGFKIYFEAIQNNDCLATVAPPTPSPPYIVQNKVACSLTNGSIRVDVSCTPDYGLVFLQSYLFVTEQPEKCNVSQHTCFYPSEQPQAHCSGSEACAFTHIIESELNLCQGKIPDAVEFSYQCLPMIPSSSTERYVFGSETSVTTESGFIETPHYPNTYEHGPQSSSITIRVPDNAENKTSSIYIYVIRSSLRDTSVLNSTSTINCLDSVVYTDGELTHSLCGKIDQPILKYHTNKQEVTLTLNISHPSSSSEWSSWHGARLFFYIGDLSLPSPPTIATTLPTITTTGIDATTTGSPSMNPGVLATIIILSILAILAVLVGFGYYRRRSALQANQEPKVEYAVDMGTLDGITSHDATEKRSSIRTDSLKGPASSAFTNPFYKKIEANDKQQIEDTTDA